jgi:hypothetical protein
MILLLLMYIFFSPPDLFSQTNNKNVTNNVTKVRNAAFVCIDTVYNNEVMTPYDVLHHT